MSDGNEPKVVVTGEIHGEIDCKRFYLRGLRVRAACPNCAVPWEALDYLSYPKMNESFGINLYCNSCEHEWQVSVQLDVNFRVLS